MNCLKSVAAMSPAPEEVIIVDDKSSKHQEIGGCFGLNIIMVKLSQHRGTAYAKNEGARLAKGRFLWFLDSDTEVLLPNMLAYGVNIFQHEERLGILGGEGVWDGHEQEWKLKVKTLYPNADTREILFSKKLCATDIKVEIISTCNFFIPRNIFLRLGGFVDYITIGEDKELSWRIRQCGYFLLDSPRFVIGHHVSIKEKELRLPFFFFANHTGQLAVAVLNLPLYALLILPVIDVCSKYARFAEQQREIYKSIAAAHGPQAQLMARYRKSIFGKQYLYFIFTLIFSFSYVFILCRLPLLIKTRIRNARAISEFKRREKML